MAEACSCENCTGKSVRSCSVQTLEIAMGTSKTKQESLHHTVGRLETRRQGQEVTPVAATFKIHLLPAPVSHY